MYGVIGVLRRAAQLERWADQREFVKTGNGRALLKEVD